MGLNKEAINDSIMLVTDYDDKVADRRFIRELLFIIENK